MEQLFVYGSLQDPVVQDTLIGRTIEGQADTLLGYRINMTLMPPYPVALPAHNHPIDGLILQVSAEELIKLDVYEGECYLRVRITLESQQEAWVYIGNPACYPDDDRQTD